MLACHGHFKQSKITSRIRETQHLVSESKMKKMPPNHSDNPSNLPRRNPYSDIYEYTSDVCCISKPNACSTAWACAWCTECGRHMVQMPQSWLQFTHTHNLYMYIYSNTRLFSCTVMHNNHTCVSFLYANICKYIMCIWVIHSYTWLWSYIIDKYTLYNIYLFYIQYTSCMIVHQFSS